jgi:tight adherence protein B
MEGFLLVLAFAWLFYDSYFAIPFLTPLIWFWHKECAVSRKQKEDRNFLRMFREWILLLSSSLSAGYSVENAIGQSSRELKMMFPKGGIMLQELKEMRVKSGNNQRPEELFMEFAKNHPFEEVKSFVEVFCTARKSGGSLNAIIRNTATQMAEVMDTRREIETMLAAKVFEQRIMTVMPAAVLLYVRIGSAEFLEGLYHNVAGILLMSVCLCVYLGAYLLGKRMVQFEI